MFEEIKLLQNATEETYENEILFCTLRSDKLLDKVTHFIQHNTITSNQKFVLVYFKLERERHYTITNDKTCLIDRFIDLDDLIKMSGAHTLEDCYAHLCTDDKLFSDITYNKVNLIRVKPNDLSCIVIRIMELLSGVLPRYLFDNHPAYYLQTIYDVGYHAKYENLCCKVFSSLKQAPEYCWSHIIAEAEDDYDDRVKAFVGGDMTDYDFAELSAIVNKNAEIYKNESIHEEVNHYLNNEDKFSKFIEIIATTEINNNSPFEYTLNPAIKAYVKTF